MEIDEIIFYGIIWLLIHNSIILFYSVISCRFETFPLLLKSLMLERVPLKKKEKNYISQYFY